MKLCLFVAFAACLVFYSVAGVASPHLETLGHGEYSFYSTDVVASPLITNTTDLGFSYIYNCNSKDAPKVRKLFTRIDGESIELESISADKILRTLNHRAISQTQISDVKIVYAYSPRGSTFIKDGNSKINLQIAVNNQTTTVGWPVILGSY